MAGFVAGLVAGFTDGALTVFFCIAAAFSEPASAASGASGAAGVAESGAGSAAALSVFPADIGGGSGADARGCKVSTSPVSAPPLLSKSITSKS